MARADAQIVAMGALKGALKNGPTALLKAYKAFDDVGKIQ